MHNISLRSLLYNKGFRQYPKDPRIWVKMVGSDALFLISSSNPDLIEFNIQEFVYTIDNERFLNKTKSIVKIRDLSEINVDDPFEYIFDLLLKERDESIIRKSDGKVKELQKLKYNLRKDG